MSTTWKKNYLIEREQEMMEIVQKDIGIAIVKMLNMLKDVMENNIMRSEIEDRKKEPCGTTRDRKTQYLK